MPKIDQLIKQSLGQIIHEEIEWPKHVLVTINKVKTARDLKYAVVWVSIMPTGQAPMILKKLAKEVKHLQQLLNERVYLRFVPKLRFEWDKTEEAADEIEILFKQLKEEKEN